jgi:four helix bundle protein
VYEEWEKTVPSSRKIDSVWKVTTYRHALFLRDLCWEDISSPLKGKRTISIADQLYRAVSSIGANIAEGCSRSTGKERVPFYQCALGFTCEARDWYYKGRYIMENRFSSSA